MAAAVMALTSGWPGDHRALCGCSPEGPPPSFVKQDILLLPLGCNNKIPQTGFLKTTNLFLTVLEAGSSRSRCLPV